MKLLILTQKMDINDDVLGFMHRWVEEFAKYCEKVTVICLFEGEHKLPENVKVLSLGKEKSRSKLKYIFNFYKYIWRERKNYDAVFVHMNKEYAVLGGLVWKMLGKKIGLWYAHGHVPPSLKIAEKLSDVIFTSTKSGFRLNSKKVKIVGQGIDVEKFKPADREHASDKKFKVITVGRISPIKDYETLIKAVELLAKGGLGLDVDIVGGVGLPEHEKYLSSLKTLIKEKELGTVINFLGSMANNDIVKHLQFADVFVNMSKTGSLDKVIIEAMACALPVITCNDNIKIIIKDNWENYFFEEDNYVELSKKIKYFYKIKGSRQLEEITKNLRKIVAENHSLNNFVVKIVSKYLHD